MYNLFSIQKWPYENKDIPRSKKLTKKEGVPPFTTTPILKGTEKNEMYQRSELVTLSKNSFPQLTQIFATDIPFLKQLQIKQITTTSLLQSLINHAMVHLISQISLVPFW